MNKRILAFVLTFALVACLSANFVLAQEDEGLVVWTDEGKSVV